MSVILAKSPRLKPEIRLAQAVSQFEADLSSEQKITFRAYRSNSCSSPPDTSDVMRLTAEIDRQASKNVAGRRCFGPRFTNFLQAVQQFAALGDVIVGGSQNIIACGVWSLVRISLLVGVPQLPRPWYLLISFQAIVNFSSYFEKLSTLFMNVGRSAPRYQTIGLLYSRSTRLQSYICEYFIVIVGLCHQLLKFAQKSTIGQITSTLSDSDIKSFQSDLDVCANSVREEMSLLMSQKIEEEARENSRFRTLSIKLSKSLSHQQKLETNLRVLKFCSSYDYETTWKQTRKIGNSTLFHQAAEYHEWKIQASSCTLAYTGKLGSGKSVCLANIVDDLHIHAQNSNIAVAYFFCRHDIPESLKAQTVIGSLARQLLRTIPDLTIAEELCDMTDSAPDFEAILKLLQGALPPDYKAYFILDGLDECATSERDTIVKNLEGLQDLFTLLLCVSFRDKHPIRFIRTRTVSIPDDNPDIESFIEAELESCLEHNKLMIGDPTLILEIRDALLDGSKGMFLWVALQIQSLCAMKTDQAIRDALADLPRDLSETFARVLRRSEGLERSYQRQILQLVLVACQLLTVDEVREALSVVPGDTAWNPSRLLNDIFSTLACCGCLLIIDEEESTVRFVHHSVKQFLLSGFYDPSTTRFTLESAQRTMMDIIVTYLSYDVFETELSTIRVPQISTRSVPSRIISSTLRPSSSVHGLALKLLKTKRQTNYNIGKTLVEALKHSQNYSVAAFHFHSYAKLYCLRHLLYFTEQELVTYDFMVRLSKGRALNAIIYGQDGVRLMGKAASCGHQAVVELLLETGKINIDSKDEDGRTPLWKAASKGHEPVVKLLLESGKVDVDSGDKYGHTPLWCAASEGHEAIVKLLLEPGRVNENSYTSLRNTPLWAAASRGHESVVKLLLESGKFNVKSTSYGELTPLWEAASKGHEAVVRLLIESRKFDINSKDYYGRTPLFTAVAGGHEAVVKLLLESSEVDVDYDDEYGHTPLWWAASEGYQTIAKLLLETGKVDVEFNKGKGNRAPLWAAASEGNEAVVEVLLETGKANVESKDEGGQTPLCVAVFNGNEAVVKLLLEKGSVNVDSKDKDGRTPLWWAAARGRKAIVELLLETGEVNLESKDNDGLTPLCMAASCGKEAIVKLLLDSGKVDVDSADKKGRTPLWWAADGGYKAVVKLLLEAGEEKI